MVRDSGVLLWKKTTIFVAWCGKEVGEITASSPLAVVGQRGQCCETRGADEAHHIAVEIDGICGGESGGLLARGTKFQVALVIASELHHIVGSNRDADGIRAGRRPSLTVLVVLDGQRVRINNLDCSCFHRLDRQRRCGHVLTFCSYSYRYESK